MGHARVVVLGALPALGHELLGQRFAVDDGGRTTGAAAIVADPSIPVTADLLDEAGASLEVVANFGVGYDNIDLDAARARGVRVTNTPGVLTNATAELAVALMLAAARRIVEADAEVRRGEWERAAADQPIGRELVGATVGLVGFGRIGRRVSELLRGFEARLLATSRSSGAPAPGVERVELLDLLGASDFVSVHVPLAAETRHLIDANALAAMKRGAILVNTSRGAVVDTTRSSRRCARAIWAPQAWTSTRTSPTCRQSCASCTTPSCCRTSDRPRPPPGTRWPGYVLRT